MKRIALALAGLAVTLALALPARAQNKTFVASSGSSPGGTCTRAAPCFSIQQAAARTDDGGEINCLDSGPFHGGSISHAVTIDCAGTSATVLADPVNGNAFLVNGNGVIRIRNLTIDGGGTVPIGIDYQGPGGGPLFVENVVIKNFNTSPALGIRFNPSVTGSQLVVTDTVIENNGVGSSFTGGGIQVAPVSGGSAGVVLNRVKLRFNVNGIMLDSSKGSIGAVMRDGVVSSSRNMGISLFGPAGGSGINFTIERSSLVNNVDAAVVASGPNSLVRIGDSTIAGNNQSVRFGFAGGVGIVQSFKENHIAGNGSDGTPLAAFPGPGGTPLQ